MLLKFLTTREYNIGDGSCSPCSTRAIIEENYFTGVHRKKEFIP